MRKIFILVLLFMSACSTRTVKVLDAPWVSMKHASAPVNVASMKSIGHIQERYCQEGWSGSFGLMDEVVKQAESKHRVDYLRNASFTREVGHLCMIVSGDGYRM